MVRVVVWYDGRRAGAQSNPDMVDVDATWGSVEARWTPRGDRGAGEGVWFFGGTEIGSLARRLPFGLLLLGLS